MLTRNSMRSILGAAFSLTVACLIWEGFARSGLFAPALAPSVVLIGSALGRMVLSGAFLPSSGERSHADPVARVGSGFHPLVRPGQYGHDRTGLLRRDISSDL